MLGRFFGGFAASAPLAIVGGAMADIWGPLERAYGICVFAAAAFVSRIFRGPDRFLTNVKTGPVAGPIMGGFITQSHLGWRWTAWITLIMAALFGCIGLAVIPETSAARILQIKAKRLRYETKNWALHAKADESRIDFDTITHIYLVRPFVMFVQEPILALITLYMSFIYGIIYLLFEAYPISFQEQRGWNAGVGSLPFAAFIVGIVMGTGAIAYSTRTNFARAFKKHGKVIPEERLPPMIIGAAVLPIGLFMFAWYVLQRSGCWITG
jgi:MFS family permease